MPDSVGMLYRKRIFSQSYRHGYSLFTPQIVNAMCSLAIMMFVSAHLLWFLESRGGNKQFQSEYWAGIDESYWWAIVTGDWCLFS